jgi:hypothetical protein
MISLTTFLSIALNFELWITLYEYQQTYDYKQSWAAFSLAE